MKSKNDVNIDFEGKTDGLVVMINGKIIFSYRVENVIIAVGILSAYSPREKDYESCIVYPLSAQIKDFKPTQNIGVILGFNAEMIKNISNYEKCILYFTFVVGEDGGMTRRWFNQYHEEYLLSNDADGKLEIGKQMINKILQ